MLSLPTQSRVHLTALSCCKSASGCAYCTKRISGLSRLSERYVAPAAVAEQLATLLPDAPQQPQANGIHCSGAKDHAELYSAQQLLNPIAKTLVNGAHFSSYRLLVPSS